MNTSATSELLRPAPVRVQPVVSPPVENLNKRGPKISEDIVLTQTRPCARLSHVAKSYNRPSGTRQLEREQNMKLTLVKEEVLWPETLNCVTILEFAELSTLIIRPSDAPAFECDMDFDECVECWKSGEPAQAGATLEGELADYIEKCGWENET